MSDPHYLWPYNIPSTERPQSLGIQGNTYVLNGRRWHAPGFTAFRSLHHFAQTRQLDPLTAQILDTLYAEYRDGTPVKCGDFVLAPRILCHAINLFDLSWDVAYQALGDHAKFLNAHRCIPTYVLFADTWLDDVAALKGQLARFGGIFAALVAQGIPLRASLVNESGNQYQPIDPADFDLTPGVLWSRGSGGAGDYAIRQPAAQWVEFHGPRDPHREYLRDYDKIVRDLNNDFPQPIEDSEPSKCSAAPDPGRAEYSDPTEAFDRGLYAAAAAHGGVWHSRPGLQCETMADLERDCWISWLRAFQAAQSQHTA